MAIIRPREVFSSNYRTRTLISSRCRHNSLMMISMLKTSLTEYSQASADKKSQREIADVAGVADVTIRQTFLFSLVSFVTLKRRKEGLKPSPTTGRATSCCFHEPVSFFRRISTSRLQSLISLRIDRLMFEVFLKSHLKYFAIDCLKMCAFLLFAKYISANAW